MTIITAIRWILILSLCAHFSNGASQAANDKSPPPWGIVMPPDVIAITPLNRFEINTPRILDNYPVWHRYYPNDDKDMKTGFMFVWTDGFNNPNRPGGMTGWRVDFPLRDGEHQILGGQVYQFDYDKNRLVRIANHPLSISPEKALDLFTVGFNVSLNFQYPKGYSCGVKIDGVRNQGTTNNPDARIICRIGGDLVTSSPEVIKRYETKGMAVGDVIETEEFTLKLEAIVPKDEKARIPGWVHFRRIPKAKPE